MGFTIQLLNNNDEDNSSGGVMVHLVLLVAVQSLKHDINPNFLWQ